MSTENQIVADFYARLWPWVDHGKPARVLLDDGGQANVAHPDLCFHFTGADHEFRIEFKILYSGGNDKNRIRPTSKQLATWTDPANGKCPHVWIAKVANDSRYLLWPHDDEKFLANFRARAKAKTARTAVQPPTGECHTFSATFVKLLEYAVRGGFLP